MTMQALLLDAIEQRALRHGRTICHDGGGRRACRHACRGDPE